MNFYDFKANDASENEVDLKEYEGKVVLVVNTATQCGFTPQYDDLQNLYEKYESDGFEVLDFPCNQFGNQAPGSNEEIVTFCDAKFGITFRHFSKIDVNGEQAHPLFRFLEQEQGFAGFDPEHALTPLLESMLERSNPNYKNEPEIKWNFTKFLIDRQGNVVARFEPTEDISVIEEKIQEFM